MYEKLEFGFDNPVATKDDKSRLSLSIPDNIWQEVIAIPGLERAYGKAHYGQSLSVNVIPDLGRTLFVNSNSIRKLSERNRWDVLSNFSILMGSISLIASHNGQEDPLISVNYSGAAPMPLFMEATVKLPKVVDENLEASITERMQKIATNLKWPSEQVRAYVNLDDPLKKGIVLFIEDQCSIGVSGETFDKEVARETVELSSNNLDTPEQQLIGLVGAVALVRSDKLV